MFVYFLPYVLLLTNYFSHVTAIRKQVINILNLTEKEEVEVEVLTVKDSPYQSVKWQV